MSVLDYFQFIIVDYIYITTHIVHGFIILLGSSVSWSTVIEGGDFTEIILDL